MFEQHGLTNQACSFLKSSLSGIILEWEEAAPDKRSKEGKAATLVLLRIAAMEEREQEAYRNDHPSWACTLGLIALAKAYSRLQQQF